MQRFLIMLAVIALSTMFVAAHQPLTIHSEEYFLGSEVTIDLGDGTYDRLKVDSEEKMFSFRGNMTQSLSFMPEDEGDYTVSLSNKGKTVDSHNFTVRKPSFRVNVEGRESTGKIISRDGRYDYRMSLGGHVREIIFRSIEKKNQTLRYEDLEPKKLRSDFIKSYAIDPEAINFTNATFTSIARGESLWKCVDYNFSQRNCFGEWKKVKDLVPGEEYTYTITPKDPGFGEAANFSDIVVNNITFSTLEAREDENITVFSNISNEGGQNASNFTVQFFVDGTQLGSNQTVSFLESNTSIQLNESWIAPGPGTFNVSVIADPPLDSNGSIQEYNESNNELYKLYEIGMYQYSYGNLTGRVTLGNSGNRTIFNFSLSQNSNANIFVAEKGLEISFASLGALGKDSSGSNSSNDFFELDTEMNTSDFSDSINQTWTSNGTPDKLRDFFIFGSMVEGVPVVNSTNTSDFLTGILWDLDDGGSEYNGSQDIVFVTEVNQDKTGKYGTYDYEIRYPSKLDYKNNKSGFALYYEIKN